MAYYVRLRKVREDDVSAGYSFSADDLQSGEATIDKSSGNVVVTRALAGEGGDAVAIRAAAKLRTVWRLGPMPESAEWAS